MASTIQPAKEENLPEKSSDDRISKLPEAILLHILSFLSIKQAATTRVLFKQWQYLLTWVPDLDIDDSEIDAEDTDDISFYRMVFNIFVSRRALRIKKLRMSCFNFNCERIDVPSILCAAVEHNIEELDFWFKDAGDTFKLPPTLFRCNTLVVFNLTVAYITGSSFHFPSLKILHLLNAEYEDEDTFRNLLSGCPVLDKFVISYDVEFLEYDFQFHYEITSLTVRRIVIEQISLSKITVNAPALEYMSIDLDPAPHVLVLNDVPSSGILGALCNVQFLELKSISGLVHDHNIPIDFFLRFDYLVELKVDSYYNCCLLPLLVKMLLNCSRLEHLILVSTMSGTCEKTQCWISPRHVSNCLAFHLTTIKFEGFQASEAEMEFIEYVLNNSKVLRNVTIRYLPEMDSKRMSDAFLKISTFEKQATRCQLNFQQLS